MNRSVAARWAGEFTVIVFGVLVALGVDDWNARRQDRELERSLLDRMQAELSADGADLATAAADAQLRLRVLDAVLAGLGDETAQTRMRLQENDSLFSPSRRDSLRALAGRSLWASPDVEARPLGGFQYRPEFDLSSTAYQEMIATGAVRILKDNALRAAVMSYYQLAEDQGGNEQRQMGYNDRLEDALVSIGVAAGDDISLVDLVAAARRVPTFAVEARRAQTNIRMQAVYYSRIEVGRLQLEEVIRDYRAGR
ncbi:MAG: hypothetical protein JSU98_05615 [Gemmatimonadales bacterium]|nr:MAG: hypothetical protein JSU98_05615 [Gemmatimonadales bacterium]